MLSQNDHDPEKNPAVAEDLGLEAIEGFLYDTISDAMQRERAKLLENIPTIYDINMDQTRPVNKADMELFEILINFARDISDVHKNFRAAVDAHRLKVAQAMEAGKKGL